MICRRRTSIGGWHIVSPPLGRYLVSVGAISSFPLTLQCRSCLVLSAHDCCVRGPMFESHRGRLCLSRMPLWYAVLGTGCAPLLQYLDQLSFASLLGRKSSTTFGWGKCGNVTSAGWQVTLCDPIWHVSFLSGVAVLCCEVLYPYTLLLLYFTLFPLLHLPFLPSSFSCRQTAPSYKRTFVGALLPQPIIFGRTCDWNLFYSFSF